MDAREKSKPGSLSLYPSQWEYLGKFKEGKSGYIQKLLSDIMKGKGTPVNSDSEDCLIDLCRNFCPTFLPEMRKACEGLDQPKALASLLMLFATGNSGLSKEFLKVAEAHSVYNKQESK